MRITLVLGLREESEEVLPLVDALKQSGLSYEKTLDKPFGAISYIPCIAALDDSGLAKKEWRPDVPIDSTEIVTWSKKDGTPVKPTPQPIQMTKDAFSAFSDKLLAANVKQPLLDNWPTE